jgi:TRAP-type uncharacterized transport system substrate-binding protein
MFRFIGSVFAACLLAIWTTSVPAANPDWPKSLTISTASPGGTFYVYGELIVRKLKFRNRLSPRIDRVNMTSHVNRFAAGQRNDCVPRIC